MEMESLTPSCSSFPGFSPECFLSGSSSPASFLRESSTSEKDKVHVAVGNSAERSMSLLSWTINHFVGKDICLLHVYHPSQRIPTPLGKLPASQACPKVVSNHREHGKEQALSSMRPYLTACSSAKVKVSTVVVEADQVQRGIVDSVNRYGIRKLVMGIQPENGISKTKKKKNWSSKVNCAANISPLFCEIWFICEGKHLWTRHASSTEIQSSSFCGALNSGPSPRSHRYSLTESVSADYSPSNSGESNAVAASSSSFSTATRLCLRDLFGSFSNRSSVPKRVASADSDLNADGRKRLHDPQFTDAKSKEELNLTRLRSADSDLNDDERKRLHDPQFTDAISEEELKLTQLRSEAKEAVIKINKFDFYLKREVKLRKEAEEELRGAIEERENILAAREDVTEELRRTRKNITLLKRWVREANRKHEEASRELKLVRNSIAGLREEKQQIWRENRESAHWLDRWRRNRIRNQGHDGVVGIGEELTEFSSSDLENATCNFSESFKIGHGVYKGELLGTTIAIRKLHPHNTQRESEFLYQVKDLGRQKHPHLVRLIGVCLEARSVVCEYFPNGSLRDNLTRKSNSLPWKIRARMVSDIASALCFLHSSKHGRVVHGNLTPRKILLDSALRCKIGGFEDQKRWSSGKYSDPELPRVGVLTTKSDVYSFGLIVLQLLTKKCAMGLVGAVRRAVSAGKLEAVLDSSAGEWPEFVAVRLAEIGLRCCELKRRERPDLSPSLVREIEGLHISEERTVPSFFLCPILQDIMKEPEVAGDGFTYEGEAIRAWLEKGKHTSPMTNLPLPHLRLTPNHAIRLAIHDWLSNTTP